MKKNILEQFLNKILNVPLWVKQLIYQRLISEIKNLDVENLFAAYHPILTFKGKSELADKNCGLDNNIYNFLQCCEEGLSVAEISVNSFFTMEEAAKLFEFCVDQNFLKYPENNEILAMSEYISGKIRIGEYYNKKGLINSEILQQIITESKKSNDKKFGQIMVDMGFVSEDDLKVILKLKEEAQKRFVLDYNEIPKSEISYTDRDKKYEAEISKLKEENSKLKRKMIQLSEMVKKDAKY